jgi:hypothetical protein
MDKHVTKEVTKPPTGSNTNSGAAGEAEKDKPRKGTPQMPDTGKPEVEKPDIHEVPEREQPEVEKTDIDEVPDTAINEMPDTDTATIPTK